MTGFSSKALLFLAICACFSQLSQSASSELEYGDGKIGQRCERDRHCIRHAFCRSQYSCSCDPYYTPTVDMSMCLATAGLGCADDVICSTMTNANCRQGVCACKEEFILDINNSSNCIPRPVRVRDRCQRNDECLDALEHSFCINEKCECFTGHHYINQTGKCVVTRTLYNACKMDYECYAGPNEPDSLYCKNGECVCKEGEPTCGTGTHYVAAGLIPMILLLTLRLL